MLPLLLLVFLSMSDTHATLLRPSVRRHYDKNDPYYTDTLEPWKSLPLDNGANTDTLELAIGFFRHGSRSPRRTYPGDKYPFNDTTYWPEGQGQLTKVGKQQTYTMGKKLRARYGKFISDSYLPSEIEVQCNRVDRIFMSTSFLLAGLYPVVKDFQVWNPDLLWQPIPFWEHPYDMTKLLKDSSICPFFYDEMLRIDKEVNQFNEQYSDLMELLNARTQLGVTNVADIYKYFDVFYFQNDNGYGFPDWLEPKDQNLLWNLHAAGMTASTAGTPQMTSLIAGPQLKEIKELLEKKMSGNLTTKMHLTGVHETSINGLLPGLGFVEPFLVEPAATYIIELHKIKGSYYIQMLNYRNSEADPEGMVIPGCQRFCPVGKVICQMNKSIPSNWQELCKLTS